MSESSLAKVLDRVIGAKKAALQTKLTEAQRFLRRGVTSSDEVERILKESEELRALQTSLLHLLEFVQTCKVVCGAPKVTRVRGGNTGAFQHRHRYVMPNVRLVAGDLRLSVTSLFTTQERRGELPGIFNAWSHQGMGHHLSFEEYHKPTLHEARAEIVRAFLREAGDNWVQVRMDVQTEWDRVKNSLDSLVDSQFEKKGDTERREFRDKLISFVRRHEQIHGMSAAALYEVLRIDQGEIEKLRSFICKNKADMSLITVEDVETALNEAHVKHVMDS